MDDMSRRQEPTDQPEDGRLAHQIREAGQSKSSRRSNRGLGRVYERGGTWWIQFSYRKKLHRESSHSKVRSKAVQLLKKRLGEIGQGTFVGPVVARTTFQDLTEILFDNYRVNGKKSLDRAQRSVKHLSNVFARDLAIEITPDRVQRYIRMRLEHAKPATVRLELAALKRMFRLGAQFGKVAQRPEFPGIAVQNTRSGFFEDEELKAVLDQLPPHLRVLIEFVNLTGWRIGEAKGLSWHQVDFAAGTVRLEPGTTKNDQGRTFPFAAMPRLSELLRSQRERTTVMEREREQIIPLVFHRWGKPIGNFHEAWRRARERAGLPGKIVHDLRRTAVRRLERAGVPRSVAMKLTGHKTESIYQRYAIVSEEDLADGVRKIAAMQTGGTAVVRRAVPIDSADSEIEHS